VFSTQVTLNCPRRPSKKTTFRVENISSIPQLKTKAKILFWAKQIRTVGAEKKIEFLKKSHGKRTSSCPRAKRAQSHKNSGRR